MASGAVRCGTAALAALLAGCAAAPHNLPRNQPLTAANASRGERAHEPVDVLGDTSVALSFSGGGFRAAAFALGVLQGLDHQRLADDTSLLDRVSFITSVSGGSLTSAYFGLHGRDGFPQFRQLLKESDGEAGLRFSLLNPANLWRLWSGGLNTRADLQGWLEGKVLGQATFADMYRRGKPLVWINATNLQQRIAFPFHEKTFEAMCSDIASFPVSEAVAASMAVPLVFAPVVLENYPEDCIDAMPAWVDQNAATVDRSLLSKALLAAVQQSRSRTSARYLKLVDGGITDNLGLTSLQHMRILLGTPHAPWSEQDAVQTRRLLFIVVDSGRRPDVQWNHRVAGPNGVDVAAAAIDAAIDTNARLSYDGFLAVIKQWQASIIGYRCALSADHQAALIEATPGWRCDDVRFDLMRLSFDDTGEPEATRLHGIPTTLRLDAADVDALIDAGTEAVTRSAAIQAFLQGVRQRISP